MIYVCIPSYNEAPTVGLLLWKIRQVFASFPREYQLLVLDDGSTVQGFVCESYATAGARDITRFGGWRAYLRSLG